MDARLVPRAGRAAIYILLKYKCNSSMVVICPSLKPQRTVTQMRRKK